MTPQFKLRTASILMFLGTAPLILGIIWIVAAISSAHRNPGQMGGSDGLLMVAVLCVTYVVAAVVAGFSALWSISITNRNAGVRSASADVLRKIVGGVLLTPLLLYIGLQFYFF